jgi:hypothetical protein
MGLTAAVFYANYANGRELFLTTDLPRRVRARQVDTDEHGCTSPQPSPQSGEGEERPEEHGEHSTFNAQLRMKEKRETAQRF